MTTSQAIAVPRQRANPETHSTEVARTPAVGPEPIEALKDSSHDRLEHRRRQPGSGVAYSRPSPPKPNLREIRRLNPYLEAEQAYLAIVEHKAGLEISELGEVRDVKAPKSAWALLNPATSLKVFSGHWDRWVQQHEAAVDELRTLRTGVDHLRELIRRTGYSTVDFTEMDARFRLEMFRSAYPHLPNHELARRVGLVEVALTNGDVNRVARGEFDGKFSWDRGEPYVDIKEFETEEDVIGDLIGEQVLSARQTAEQLKNQDGIRRGVGLASAAVLDGVSAGNQFVKSSLETANQFYAQQSEPQGPTAAFAKVGGAMTNVGGVIASIGTSPATVFDHRANRDERAQAVMLTGAIAASAGIVKLSGPAQKSLVNAVFGAKQSLAGRQLFAPLAGQLSKLRTSAGRMGASLNARLSGIDPRRIREALRRKRASVRTNPPSKKPANARSSSPAEASAEAPASRRARGPQELKSDTTIRNGNQDSLDAWQGTDQVRVGRTAPLSPLRPAVPMRAPPSTRASGVSIRRPAK